MNKSKIEWCDMTWNPITGCLHNCQYCYAKGITRRFCTNEHGKEGLLSPCTGECKACSDMDGVEFITDKIRVSHGNEVFPFGFYPTVYLNRMSRPAEIKQPQNVFVCSMADLFGEWVPDEYIKKVFDACAAAPWHRYLFLTKNPSRYIELAKKDILPRDHWYGYSVTTEADLWRFNHADDCPCLNLFVSIEPIHGPIPAVFSTHCPADWIIFGAETGNRKDKIIPRREWFEDIVNYNSFDRKIFIKNSLAKIWGEPLVQEYPWETGKNAGGEA